MPATKQQSDPQWASASISSQLLAFILVTALFFLWGIPNNLNDILIRQFIKSFAINRVQAGLVQSAFYMGYFLLAMPAALLKRRAGYKVGFIIGCSCSGPDAFYSGLQLR
jgi:MFS transporter, FHS family, L-fucose permease